MSTAYDTEPQPTASVVLHTTSGEIAVELFAKQTPLTSRNFLQHCLDGYYDNTIFHRIVPGFIAQGGDPTGSGHGGESIYDGGALAGDLDPWPMDERRGANAGAHGVGFKDEFHSRLRFNRRGLLGMANEGRPDTNGSQFFFTLDRAEELNNKNTLFGRVAGPTIYNLTKIGQSEVQDGTERPLYPTKVTRIEIVTNPFADMRRTERDARRGAGQQTSSAPQGDKKKAKRKKGVNKSLLSFGDDVEDDLEATTKNRKKAKVAKDGADAADGAGVRRAPSPKTTTLPSRTHAMKPSKPLPPARDDDGDDSDGSDASASSRRASSVASPPQRKPQLSALEKTKAEIAALKASMRRTVAAEPTPTEDDHRSKSQSALDAMVPTNAARGRKLSRKSGLSSHDPKTLRFLNAFTAQLGQDAAAEAAAPAGGDPGADAKDSSGGDGEDGGDGQVCDLHFIANCQSCRPWDKTGEDGGDADSDGEGWMSHTLNCAADKLGKDLSYRKKAEEELVVIDPRERAQALKDDRRGARDGRGRDREGGRGGGRSWDQARHAKMAQAAALSGRGAR